VAPFPGELVADFFAGPNQYGYTGASLQKYFDTAE
jgi:hypothetical protein